jgi:hypothetical protein
MSSPENWYELLGYLASLLVAVSLMMRSVVRLRIINLLGAVCFSIYGLLIGSAPVAGMNAFIVGINIVQLWRLARSRTAFAVVEAGAEEPFLQAFLRHYAEDLRHFFPGLNPLTLAGRQFYLVLRDAMPVGVVITEAQPACEGETACRLDILADYVIPGYRDLRPGQFFYSQSLPALKQRGIRSLRCVPGPQEHRRYLEKMGFRQQGEWMELGIQ